MLIKATLSNARHPEYGEVTIPFPIKTSEYDHIFAEKLMNHCCGFSKIFFDMVVQSFKFIGTI